MEPGSTGRDGVGCGDEDVRRLAASDSDTSERINREGRNAHFERYEMDARGKQGVFYVLA